MKGHFSESHKKAISKSLIGRGKTHGATKKLFKDGVPYRSWTPEYIAWHGMKDRCYTKKSKNYKSYGGRGIVVCKRWKKSFEKFLEDVGYKPEENYSLDRINVNGNYTPSNVRWATPRQQRLNQRDIKKIKFKGITKSIVEWAEDYHIRPKTLFARLGAGWSIEDAITRPVDKKRKRPKKKLTNADMWIRTYRGHKLRPFSPKPETIDIYDIAHSLSNQCRFAGQSSEFYSLAEHSFRVSQLVPPKDALWALLHDAAEAYFGDLITPIKHHPNMGFYRYSEDRLMKIICRKFGLNTKRPESVTQADRILLATEARDLVGNPVWAEGMQKLERKIVPKSSVRAETEFLDEFHRLTGGKWK